MKQLARLVRRATRLPTTTPLICAALCLALTAACAQPPSPQPIATPIPPTTAPPSPTTTALPTATPIPPTPPPTPTATPIPPVSTPLPFTAPAPEGVVFTQIALGKQHGCGLIEDGAILCWGYDEHNSGSRDAPAGTGYRQVAAGLHFACALRHDHTIVCWGSDEGGKATPPQGSFSEIALAIDHACAIPVSQEPQPQLSCWGAPFPNGPETIPLDDPISSIRSGKRFTCGLTPQGDMACAQMNDRSTEITPGPFTRLDVGIQHACALREDGSVFCQGSDYQFQATPPSPSTKFIQIAAGWFHSCGITQARAIECWGSGVRAAPGERLTAPDGEFVAIRIGWRNSCALRPSGLGVCWHTPRYLRPSDSEIDDIPDGVSIAFGGAIFNSPVDIFPWQNGGIAVVEREGVIAAYHDWPNAPPPQTILDISGAVVCCQAESGMLSAAPDPQFQDFPFLYVWYQAVADNVLGESAPGFAGRLSRFRIERGAAVPRSELIILEVPLPTHFHLGGAVRFGADGMLYLGIGDGEDPADAQALDNLRGKIIRIDIRGATPAQPYRIPPDNPFVDNPGARPEIWAYGLRNPWRMAFDSRNPVNLFVADVGASTWEEISIASAGANLGWPHCEGNACRDWVDLAALTPPILAYGRDVGCVAIGGIAVPWLNDGFIFGDLCARRVWLLEPDNSPDAAQASAPDAAQEWRMRQIADLSEIARTILAFGPGEDGSVYILSHDDPIRRLDPSFADDLPAAPAAE